jgi:hypothetical protein
MADHRQGFGDFTPGRRCFPPGGERGRLDLLRYIQRDGPLQIPTGAFEFRLGVPNLNCGGTSAIIEHAYCFSIGVMVMEAT